MTQGMWGRDVERAALLQRLGERRLVTLVGPGGIGKTALARSVVDEAAVGFANGAVEVDLTRVDDADGVFEAIAGQLGYADFESLIDSPGDQPTLVVVDNCEHVLDAAADAIARMLAACRMPTVLATSRSPLDLPGESLLTIAALPIPDAGFADPDVASVGLFVERARDHGVELTAEHLVDAAEVCRRLDGVPLALELAAARLRAVGLTELIAELEAAPHALGRRRFRGQTHHRSVGEVVGWSYRLLAPEEQRVFVELGVFAGPFRGQLAERVVDGAQDHLDALVDASLLTVDRAGSDVRYRMLHPVRAVARDLLDRSGEADRLRARLVDATVAATTEIAAGGATGWRPRMLDDLLASYDDAAASIRWTLDHDHSPDRALTLVAVLWGIVHNSHSREIHRLGEAVLDRWPDPTVRRWPNAAATVASCRFLAGDPAGALALAGTALDHAGGSRTAPALLRRVMAQSLRAQGRGVEARDMFRLAADTAAERGAAGLEMELRVDEGLADIEGGEVERGLAVIDAVLDRAAGAPINRCWARAARVAAVPDPDARRWRRTAEDVLTEATTIGYPAGVSYALRSLARAALASGDLPAAARASLDLLDSLLQRGGLDEMRVVLDVAAELLRRTGRSGWVDLIATAERLPVTSFLCPVDLGSVATGDVADGRVLSSRDAYVTTRAALTEIAADAERAARPVEPPATARAGASIVAEGDVVRVDFGGRSVRLRRSKGLDDLAHLVARPGVEVPSVDLMGALVVRSSSESEALDVVARRRYEDRVRELHAEIEQAQDDHDIGRSERLRVELDLLVDELTAALGVGGRRRTTAAPSEKARSAVTQRVRSTIKRIGQHHPELADHLRRSVNTGTYCSYTPPEPVTWTVRT